MRLPPQPGEVLDRDAPLRFEWNGRSFHAYDGDTVVSALAAAGERVFSRSLKYHRRRGLLTASFHDPNCVVQIGEEPNVRGAHRQVRQGMQVRAQNAWPTLRFDVKAVNSRLGRFLPPGFYYKTFVKPRALWPWYQRVLRRFAAGGRITKSLDDCQAALPKRHAHPDVLVAGGGPAGMAAAAAAARAGARVMLVEEEPALGGSLRWGDAADLQALRELHAQLEAAGDVEVCVNAVVAGRYDDNWTAVVRRDAVDGRERLVKARAATLVVAPGLIERPYVFAGNDLPGVMLSTAVRRLINLYAVKPGKRAVVLTANASGDAAVADLERAGVEVVAVADAREGGDVVRALGRRELRGVRLGDGRRVRCDLLVVAAGWTAPTSLLNMAGCDVEYDPRCGRFRPDLASLPDSVLAAGAITGDGDVSTVTAHGEAVGAEAARRARGEPATTAPALDVDEHPQLFRGPTHGIVDYSEDVSSKDIFTAVSEGYRSVELAKRYTTATMGPAQGKLETVNTAAVVAEALGTTIGETGATTWRPPYAPITLGALAGPHRTPTRRSPIQTWHESHGATPLIAGDWIRPDHYGDPAAEARAVRESVGVIDVTPIGKIELRGPDVPNLLNLVYVNKWSKLPVGKVRYGAMCGEDGVVFDDGVTGRLSEDRYLMSTTSTGAAAVAQWLEMWLQTEHPDWQVHVTQMTSAYVSCNVAGPRSRELLRRLVDDVDLDPESFGYMQVRQGRVAGVDGCVLWRIGFTGELSYEIHAPSGHGMHLWQRLLDAGADLDVRPFGVEAQRILRLEKGHLIVGQDTDGLTKGPSASLGALIKLDKTDFAGRPELAAAVKRADGPRLVALTPTEPAVVPDEGCQLLDAAGTICGRVTSSRMSPTLGRSVCLAQVDVALAEPDAAVSIRLVDGRTVAATVAEHLAAVDPEGSRLRG